MRACPRCWRATHDGKLCNGCIGLDAIAPGSATDGQVNPQEPGVGDHQGHDHDGLELDQGGAHGGGVHGSDLDPGNVAAAGGVADGLADVRPELAADLGGDGEELVLRPVDGAADERVTLAADQELDHDQLAAGENLPVLEDVGISGGEVDDFHVPTVSAAAPAVNNEKKPSDVFTLGANAAVFTARRPAAATPPVPEQPKPRRKTGDHTALELRSPPPLLKPEVLSNPNRIAFKSTNIEWAELDPSTETVEVKFVGGARYRYANFTRKDFESWRQAPSAGSWFHREIRCQSRRHPIAPPRALEPANLSPLGMSIGNVAAKLEARPFTHTPVQAREPGTFREPTLEDTIARAAPVLAALAPLDGGCPHTLLRELSGGACPVCPSNSQTGVDSSSAVALGSAHGGGHHDGPQVTNAPAVHVIPPASSGLSATGAPVGSPPGMGGATDGSNPGTPTNVRPPLVEQAPIAPSGVVHGPGYEPAPDYMRQPLRTLSRTEATALLTKLGARRMRARLSRAIRGPSGTGTDGMWHVLEGGELEWNFHHDAICDHTQLMFEEWELAGFKKPEQVIDKLAAWKSDALMELGVVKAIEDPKERADEVARAEVRVDQVQAMIDHWTRPIDEYVETKARVKGEFVKIYGCGGGRYKQRTADLAINVGPISLKSRIVMVFAVAWMWTRVPEWEAFCSSGTPSNVSRDSLATRDLVTDAWYRDTFAITWTIRDDLNRVDKWGTTAGGSREARGSGGKVTGIHADALLLDDPDDASDVWSDASRRDIMLFWRALGNRLKDPKRPVRLIVQQNLHEEDLSTRTCLEGMPRLAIPVEFKVEARHKLYTAPFGWVDPRTVDLQSLHAERFPPDVIAAERIRLGTHGFEAQYNCNPTPIGGGLIQRLWFRFFRVEDPTEGERTDMIPRPSGCVGSGGEFGTIDMHPAIVLKRKRNAPNRNDVAWLEADPSYSYLDLDWLTVTVDATFGSLKDTASAVGLLVIGGKAQRRYVFDDRTEPRTFHGTVAAIKGLLRVWPAKRVLIELKANGAAIIEELTLLMSQGDVLGPDGKPISIAVTEVNPDGGKESRAAAMVPSIEALMWYVLEGAHWLEAFLAEVCSFPHAKRDDRVDAMSQLATYYREPDVKAKWRSMSKK